MSQKSQLAGIQRQTSLPATHSSLLSNQMRVTGKPTQRTRGSVVMQQPGRRKAEGWKDAGRSHVMEQLAWLSGVLLCHKVPAVGI